MKTPLTLSIVALAFGQQALTPLKQRPPAALDDYAKVVELLQATDIVFLPDGAGGFVKTIRFTGVNVQIVNGEGQTLGAPNGLGNLVLGYNEPGTSWTHHRTGSHSLVVGPGHTWQGCANLLVGEGHAVNLGYDPLVAPADGCALVGGAMNVAGSDGAACLGGTGNAAWALGSVVVGGQGNGVTGGAAYGAVGGGGATWVNDPYDWQAGSLHESDGFP